MKELFSTREVAAYLGIHEKNVYGLVRKGLPGTKVTGKWLFPKNRVDSWLEQSMENFSGTAVPRDYSANAFLIAGSDDPLLSRTVSMWRRMHRGRSMPDTAYVPAGSSTGLSGIRKGWARIAGCHIYDPVTDSYNDSAVRFALGDDAVRIRFALREQGLTVRKGNPRSIRCISDLAGGRIIFANRETGTGTRTLLDYELRKHGISWSDIRGYDSTYAGHLDVAIAVATGTADAGLTVGAAARVLDLDFVPVRTEIFELVVRKEEIDSPLIQDLLEFSSSGQVREAAGELGGYDMEGVG